jgi:hypothetical protein
MTAEADVIAQLTAEVERLRGWWSLLELSRDPHAAYCARNALSGKPVPEEQTKAEGIWR